MYYTVNARFKSETAAEYLQKLTDGTIASQKPDGKEILASMKRAIIDDDQLDASPLWKHPPVDHFGNRWCRGSPKPTQ